MMSGSDHASSGRIAFGLDGTKVQSSKMASTMDWTTEDSDDENNKSDVKIMDGVEEDGNSEEEENSEDEMTSESEAEDSRAAVSSRSEAVEDDKTKTKSKAPLTKKDKKEQRELELKELEKALSDFGLTQPTAPSEAGEAIENHKTAENIKKKKKKKNGTVAKATDTEELSEVAVAVSVPATPSAVDMTVDAKDILLQRTKKSKKPALSEAAKAAAAEAKSRVESEKKKKPKNKSKAGYNEMSY